MIELMATTQGEFSSLKDPRQVPSGRGLLRKVAVAPGSWGSPAAASMLAAALDEEP